MGGCYGYFKSFPLKRRVLASIHIFLVYFKMAKIIPKLGAVQGTPKLKNQSADGQSELVTI